MLVPLWTPDQKRTVFRLHRESLEPLITWDELVHKVRSEYRTLMLKGLVSDLWLTKQLDIKRGLKALELIERLGPDRFSQDFEWYFGGPPPENGIAK